MSEKNWPAFETIRLSSKGLVTHLTLNRPDCLNAISTQMLKEISAALDLLADDAGTRVIVVKGEGRAFSSGYDLGADGYSAVEKDIVDDYDALEKNLQYMMKLWRHPKPVIASVHGYCLAGATQLCVFCDITVVAEDAVIGLPALPAGGGFITPLWTPLVGPKRAKQMSFVPNSRISGKTASEWGWANYAVPAAELEDSVDALALQISRVPSRILRMKKMAINRAWDIMGFSQIVPLGAE
ncbi:MAG: enoyl-CoA hydratase-related protein, partial [Desulfobacterales bacterium]|nr:enoyl-CoA hydratase-related protein [Desulfobacterales bacterium]